ncbi:MAG: hypothetical protein U0T73_14225 [Chitinophagales bacterium]
MNLKSIFILLVICIVLTNCNESVPNNNDAFEVYKSYLGHEHKLVLNQSARYVIVVLYCVHCGNCSSKLDLKALAKLAKQQHTIIIFDSKVKLAKLIKENGLAEVVIDHDLGLYRYGLEGTRNRVFYFSNGKLTHKELL